MQDRIWYFHEGSDLRAYEWMGAHPASLDSDRGYVLTVWAPAAAAVSAVGDFNRWDPAATPMDRIHPSGIWRVLVPEARRYDRYRFWIRPETGDPVMKSDPFAFHAETRPASASILYGPGSFPWTDDDAIRRIRQAGSVPSPLSIYEVHPGSFRRHADGHPLDYRELARELGRHVREMGFTHVEFLPVMEHPLDESWGYQVTGFFAPTSRFGTPDDFRFLVDHLHGLGIGVILDWVPAHFPRDGHGLARFDGSCLYEYADPRLGEHAEWGTLVFDYSRPEVRSFLLSSANYWIESFHADGLRVDAVSSMLYRDYGRTDWLPNEQGGRENLEAIRFLQQLCDSLRSRYPGLLLMAEESTTFPGVTHSTESGGLGFTHKWNMGWMHDTLAHVSRDYIHRRWHQEELTFSMVYAFSEHFVLPLSHDEVVHGKRSLIGRMPGDPWRKFASLRTLYGYMMAHPGGKLLFMGGEFGQFVEWRFAESLEWFLLKYETHRTLMAYVKALQHVYRADRSLWEQDDSWQGFRWHRCDDAESGILAFSRWSSDGRDMTLVVLNWIPAPQNGYRIGVPFPGEYRVVLDSDDPAYGGSGYRTSRAEPSRIVSAPEPADGLGDSIRIDVPPLAAVYMKHQALPDPGSPDAGANGNGP